MGVRCRSEPVQSWPSRLSLGAAGQPCSALLEVFTEGRSLAEAAQPTPLRGVSIVPAAPHLMAADRVLASEVGIELALRRALDDVSGYRYVLVDCPPSLGLLVIAALTGCREVLVPVAAHVMELAGLVALVQTVDTVRERLNPGLRITGIVACRVDSRTKLAREVVSSLRERFGDLVLAPAVCESVQVAEAPSHGDPITGWR